MTRGGSAGRVSTLASGPAVLHVREVGLGRPVIVVHGGPDFDYEYLLPDMDRLAEHVRLVYYDQRGRGRSAAGVQPDDVTVAGEVEDLDRVRTWTRSSAVAVLAHSWGAVVALEYAIHYPDRVSKLILVSPAPVSGKDAMAVKSYLDGNRTPAERARLAKLRSEPGFQRGDLAADAEYHRIHFRLAVRDPADLDRVVGSIRRRSTPAGIVLARAIEDRLYAETWENPSYRLAEGLRELHVPTLILHGEHDLVPVEITGPLLATIPGAQFQLIRDCGHFAYLEKPDQFVSAVVEFVNAEGDA